MYLAGLSLSSRVETRTNTCQLVLRVLNGLARPVLPE
jgi:hypothetical protein